MEVIVHIDTASNVIQISGIYLISAWYFSGFLMQIEKFNSKMLVFVIPLMHNDTKFSV